MSYPTRKYDVIFINPTLTGLFASWNAHGLGAKVGIIVEKDFQNAPIQYPPAFPHYGTFRPSEIDSLASETGFAPPKWEQYTRLTLRIYEHQIVLDTSDGPGGLLLALTKPFSGIRPLITGWLSEHVEKISSNQAAERLTQPVGKKMNVADSLDSLREAYKEHPEIEVLRIFGLAIDTVAMITSGRGIAEIGVTGLSSVLKTFLNGWHSPSRQFKDWTEVISQKIIDTGISWIEIDAVESIGMENDNRTVVEASDGQTFSGHTVVINENDRFAHPSIVSPQSLISWHDTWCDITETSVDMGSITELGIIRPDLNRPPINDNFVSWKNNPGSKTMIISAPLETRFTKGGPDRISMMRKNLIELVSTETGLKLVPEQPEEESASLAFVTFPGRSRCFICGDGSTQGTDLVDRMLYARKLSESVAESLKATRQSN